jgi:hypothetical protein
MQGLVDKLHIFIESFEFVGVMEAGQIGLI